MGRLGIVYLREGGGVVSCAPRAHSADLYELSFPLHGELWTSMPRSCVRRIRFYVGLVNDTALFV